MGVIDSFFESGDFFPYVGTSLLTVGGREIHSFERPLCLPRSRIVVVVVVLLLLLLSYLIPLAAFKAFGNARHINVPLHVFRFCGASLTLCESIHTS